MRKTIITLALVLLSVPLFAQTRAQIVAKAIARAEGFGVKGAIPTRYRNPGDLKVPAGFKYPGQVGVSVHGYAIFRTERDGWRALEAQLEKLAANASSRYSLGMTLAQYGKKYSGDDIWARIVAKSVGVPTTAKMWEVLDVPPVIRLTCYCAIPAL